MKKNKLIIIILALLFLQQGKAQENHHEFSVWAGGGLSSIQYKLNVGDHKPGYGGILGLGYSYFFRPNWGINTGVEFTRFNGKTNIQSASDSYDTFDDESDPFTFMAEISDFEEKQHAYYLNIPLMIQYQGNGPNKFYTVLGGKIGIPINGSYINSGNYETKGKYDPTRDEFSDMPNHGFGKLLDKGHEDDLELDLNLMLSVEAGYKWKVGEKSNLYVGAYCDYGLNDIRKDKNTSERLLQYNPSKPDSYEFNSITQSCYTVDNVTTNYSEKLHLFSLGIKLKFAFEN